jgi:hypothetical protein
MDEVEFAAAPNCPNCLLPMTAVVGAWFCEQCGHVDRPEEEPKVVVAENDFEIPQGLFGFVPEALPRLIGKVVMLAALLETKIEALASQLDNHPQAFFGGRGPGANSEIIRARLPLYQSTPDEVALSLRIESFLVDANNALELRNFIVHGVWPSTNRRGWWAWKPIRQKRGVNSPRWIDDKTLVAGDFVSLCGELNKLIERAAPLIAYSGGVARRP